MSHPIRKMVIWPFLMMLLTACAGTSRLTIEPKTAAIEPATAITSSSPQRNSNLVALEVARNMLGVRYRYGGKDPSGFDCSGLVHYSFGRAGIRLPRTSRDIFRASQPIASEDLRPGDLVFFNVSADKLSHVGIYAGNNRFIHAPSAGKKVSYASLNNPYWQKRLVGLGRF